MRVAIPLFGFGLRGIHGNGMIYCAHSAQKETSVLKYAFHEAGSHSREWPKLGSTHWGTPPLTVVLVKSGPNAVSKNR